MFEDPSLKRKIQNKTLRRLDSVVEIFNGLLKRKFFSGVYLNLGILYTAIESYFIDLERIRYFHKIKFNNKYKKAAFTLKWFVKLRPIMIDKKVANKNLKLEHILANEIFALIVALNLLGIDIEEVSDEYLANMIYILRYRNVEGLILSSHMYLLERGVKGHKP